MHKSVNMKGLIFFLAIVMVFLSPHQCRANDPHHLYMGIWITGGLANPGGGGWDNDSASSLDREMVAWQGKNFGFEETFMSADDVASLDLITYQELENIWYYGRVPVVNLNFNSHIYQQYSTPHCVKSLVDLDIDLSNASSDAYMGLVKWATGLKMWFDLHKPSGKPEVPNNRYIFLAFMYEPNFSLCVVENDPSTWALIDPVAYKSMFRKGRTIVESTVGAEYVDSIRWFFAPSSESNNSRPGFEAYYPGDDVVDWMGLSGYNFGGYVKQNFTYPWQYFKDFAAPYLDRLRALAPAKPLALLQTAGISFGGDKNAWLVNFLSDATRYPKLYLLMYFNQVKPGENGFAPGFDWPVFWNDAYDARPFGFPSVYFPAGTMRYQGWLDALSTNTFLKFSPVYPMPAAGAFSSRGTTGIPYDIAGNMAPTSNQYSLFPELKNLNGDSDGDGVFNVDELAAGLDPLVADKQLFETNCHDGIDNDANGRIDSDDTVACGDIPLSENSAMTDSARQNEDRFFQFTVPGGSTKAEIKVQGITGNVHLYVKKDGSPTSSVYDYDASQTGSADIVLDINNPAAGVWHILVHSVNASTYSLVVKNTFLTSPRLSGMTNAIVCDIDGNGQDDMIFSIDNYGVQVFANNSTWMNLSVDGTNPSQMLCNDVLGDGKKRVVGVWDLLGVMKYFDTGSWSWQEITTPGSLPDIMRSGDMDADGKEDLVGVFRGATDKLQYRSSATGLWIPISLEGLPAPDDILVANMDNDPAIELVGVFRGAIQKVKIYKSGTGTGSGWTDVSMPGGVTGMPDIVAVADIDYDGIGDLVAVWSSSPPYGMYARSGFNKAWRELVTTSSSLPESKPSRIFIGDVDGDKKEDIISVWDSWNQIQIFRQIWFGWMIIYDETQRSLPQTILVGNFDGDTAGRKDVALIWNDGIRIWMNNSSFEAVAVGPPAYAADFVASPVSGVGPLLVSFTDLSNNSPTSWLWNFGDGTTSVDRNPVHTYKKTSGTFTVTLTATGSGVSPSVTKNDFISVTACPNAPYRIGGVIQNFADVQSAYVATPDGQTLEIQALDFTGNVDITGGKSVNLHGGFWCDFSPSSEHTEIKGLLTITDGSLTIANITLK